VERLPIPTPMPDPAIDGWLFLLCLMLTVVYPASVLYEMFTSAWPALSRTHDPERLVLLTVFSLVFVSVGALSLAAGVRLWAIKPGAVRFAKRFFLIYLCAHLAYFAFWFLLTRSNNSLSLARMAWFHVAGPLPAFFLWTSYLEHSKRVRRTYPSNELP
jgi:hypothetical protein